MELYEAAIQSTRTHGFAQYEVLGLELFALFWLTATSRPKDHVASGYVKRGRRTDSKGRGKGRISKRQWSPTKKKNQNAGCRFEMLRLELFVLFWLTAPKGTRSERVCAE
jgi:hypothetical protein